MSDKETYAVLFCCGTDFAPLRLTVGPYGLYYRCLRYDRKNRPETEPACLNQLSVYHAQLIEDRITALRREGKMKEGLTEDLSHYTFTVLQVRPHFILIAVENHKKQRKR